MKSLLGATEANLRKRSFSSLSLTVTEANSKAVALYRRLKFDEKRVLTRTCGKDEIAEG